MNDERLIRKWMSKWEGGNSQVWEYTVSLRTLVIRIMSEKQSGNLHVICLDTQFICGPLKWPACHFELDRVIDQQGDNQYLVRDDTAGFLVRCGKVEVKENVKPIF